MAIIYPDKRLFMKRGGGVIGVGRGRNMGRWGLHAAAPIIIKPLETSQLSSCQARPWRRPPAAPLAHQPSPEGPGAASLRRREFLFIARPWA